ncbi:MAG: DMT family transporter [Candidatus Nanopelagicales bacterium]|nr:DMT family transporter [Candidatus Nanopelagicales bacterium]
MFHLAPISLLGRLALVSLSLVAGAATVVQSRINGEIGVIAGNGLMVASLSFSVSLATTLVIIAVSPRLRRSVARAWRTMRQRLPGPDPGRRLLSPWHLLGGIGGATFVVAQGVSVPMLGVAVFTIAVVAGQNVNSLLVDRAGLGPAGKKPLSLLRCLAATITTGGVALAVSGQLDSPAFGVAGLVLALVAGAAVAAQQAVNARVAVAGGSPWAAALFNFSVGWLAVGAVTLVLAAATDEGRRWPDEWFEPWMLTGGLIGVAFIVVAAVAVSRLGVLLFALSSIAGQVVGALALAVFLPTPGVSVGLTMILGVLVTGAGAGLAAYWSGDGYQARRQTNRIGDQG